MNYTGFLKAVFMPIVVTPKTKFWFLKGFVSSVAFGICFFLNAYMILLLMMYI